MRRRRLCGAALGACAAAMAPGCAMPPPPPPRTIAPQPRLFAGEAAGSGPSTRGRVALRVTPEVRSLQTGTVALPYALRSGAMVEQALALALGDGLQGGVQLLDPASPAGSGFDAVLELRWVQLEFMPHAYPPRTVALSFDSKVDDTAGRTAWSRIYHDARIYPMSEQLYLVAPGENSLDAEVRLAHEAAWRLAQQVLRDLRQWLATERMKEREL